MTARRIPCRRGIALPLAIFGLVVVGGLASAALWLGVAQSRAGRSVQALVQALAQAELAAAVGIARWDTERLGAMAVGAEAVDTARTPDARMRSITRVRRLNARLFLITGEGTSGDGGALRRVAVLAHLRAPRVDLAAPLIAAGPVVLGPDARVDPHPDAHAPGCIPAPRDPADTPPAIDTLFEHVEDLASWIARATKVVPPGRYAGVGPSYEDDRCLVQDIVNWGDPTGRASPCGTHLPIVHVPGDIVLLGGMGQGVLVVEGDLTMDSGFLYHGLVLVEGVLTIAGWDTQVVGAVQVRGSPRGAAWLNGHSRVLYSPCAVARAVHTAARLMPLSRRAWVDVY